MKACGRCIFKHFVFKIAEFIPGLMVNEKKSVKQLDITTY